MSEENNDENNVVSIDSARKASPTEGMSDDLRKRFWSDVLFQLTGSQRFLEFVDRNYHIGMAKNDETMEVIVQVTEKPVVMGPPIAHDQLFKLHVACMRAGARNPAQLVEHICSVLGQEAPRIQIATEEELRQAVEREDLKSKLDP